jgi:hypothetical protein
MADGGLTTPNRPVLLAQIALTGAAGTQYLATRQGVYGGQAYRELLLQGLTLSQGMDRWGAVSRNSGTLMIANTPDATGARFSDLLATETFDNVAIEIRQGAVNMRWDDALPVFCGVGLLPEEGAYDDQTFTLELLDEGQPARPDLVALRATRMHRVLGSRVTATLYPHADPDAIGAVRNEVFGAVFGLQALAVDAGAADALAAAVTAGQATLPLSDLGLAALFPASGTVQVEAERVTYTGKTTLALTGCTRGTGGTTAAAHPQGAYCWEVRAQYTWEWARHACQAIDAVFVDGVRQDAGAYSVDLSGPTLIHFTARPTRQAVATVTQQPVHTSTVTGEQTPGAITTGTEQSPGVISTTGEQGPGSITTTGEQSPGSIGVSSEQSPGSISTTAEHGHSMGTGSHDHDADKGVHEYPSSPTVPTTLSSATTTLTFAASPKSGTTASFHMRVTSINTSGAGDQTVKIKRDTTVICSISANDIASGTTDAFGTDTSPGTSYTIALGAQVTSAMVAMIERDVTAVVASTADAAAGISASASGATTTSMASLSGSTAAAMAALTGATATSMVSLTGATAASMGSLVGATTTSMANLGGSTAVSTSRTTDVVVSGGEVAIGRVITADGRGWQDDASGTYTGSPSAIVTNPADQARLLLCHAAYLGLAPTALDAPTWAAARAACAAAGIRADWALTGAMDSSELLYRLATSTASRIFLDQAGTWKLYVLPLAAAPAMTINEGPGAADVLGPESGGGPIRVGRTRLTDLVNDLWVLYAKRPVTGAYWAVVQAADAASQTRYRTVNTCILENDFLQDATAAAAVAAKLLAHHQDVRDRAHVACFGLPTLHLEPCDTLGITAARLPGGWAAEPCVIESIHRTLCPAGGQPDRCEIVCVAG